LREAISYGVACGTAATINAGTGLCNINDVNMIHEHIVSLNRVDTEIF